MHINHTCKCDTLLKQGSLPKFHLRSPELQVWQEELQDNGLDVASGIGGLVSDIHLKSLPVRYSGVDG